MPINKMTKRLIIYALLNILSSSVKANKKQMKPCKKMHRHRSNHPASGYTMATDV
jgi:hypothetical protein